MTPLPTRRLRSVLLATAGALAVSLALYAEVALGGRVLFFRDVLNYYWPMRTAAALAWAAGTLPQWDPSHFAGVPLLGDPHAAVLYPPNLLHQWLDFPRAYALLLVLHHAWLGLGAAAWLRREGLGVWGAAAGALALLLCGYVTGLHLAGPLLVGAAWVPWSAWAQRARHLPPLRRAVLLALVLLAQALSGDPQSVVYSVLLCATLAAWERVRRPELLALGAGVVLAGALAAVQLVPAWHALAESTRQATAGPAHWTLAPLRLLELVVPYPFGSHLGTPRFWASFTFTGPSVMPFAPSLYLGASLLPLVLLGAARDRRTGAALTLLGLGVLLALGGNAGLGWVHADVPPFRFFRYPEKYVLVTCLGWALLAGAGVSRVADAAELGRRRVRAALVGPVALGLGLALVWVLDAPLRTRLAGTFSAHRVPVSVDEALTAARTAAGTAALFCTLALGAVALARRLPGRPAGPALLLAVVGVDLLLPARSGVWTHEAWLYGATPPPAAAMRAAPGAEGPWRFWRDHEGLNAVGPRARDLAEVRARRAWEVATLRSNLGAVSGLEEAGGYGALVLRRTDEALRATGASHPAALSAVFNVCYVLGAAGPGPLASDAAFTAVEEWPALRARLYRARTCPPRLRTVGLALAADGPARARALLGRPEVGAGAAAVVEGLGQDRALGAATVRDAAFTATGASATVDAPEGGALVVLSTAAYPGWRAEVDGARVPVERVNVATMGAWVPAGTHRVEFRFRDPGLVPGAALSLLGALGALGAWRAGRRRQEAVAP